MYQYRGYEIDVRDTGEVIIRDSSGQFVQEFECESEAEDFIDQSFDESETSVIIDPDIPSEIKEYYVYRINKHDTDNYSNYQYYNGRCFRYGPHDIEYLTHEKAESVVKWYTSQDDVYNYHIGKHHK